MSVKKTTQLDFIRALVRLYSRKINRISAQTLADEMWPDARHNNARGQTFNLAAGVAGRMLRNYRGCWEAAYRQWEIIPEVVAKSIEDATEQTNDK